MDVAVIVTTTIAAECDYGEREAKRSTRGNRETVFNRDNRCSISCWIDAILALDHATPSEGGSNPALFAIMLVCRNLVIRNPFKRSRKKVRRCFECPCVKRGILSLDLQRRLAQVQVQAYAAMNAGYGNCIP